MRYVIAIGGNALSSKRALQALARSVIALFKKGNEIVLTHGNGPQVGRLALHEKRKLALLTEETEREMGNEIGKAIASAAKGDKRAQARIVITHVIVDEKDREFGNPTKPIGRFYSKREARLLSRRGFVVKPLLNGYRRVVPSPRPKEIIEIKKIMSLAKRSIVIAAGGGGVAVTKRDGHTVYEDAVIDKDLASSLLATKLKADGLFILTNVSGVFLGFETKHQRLLRKVKASELLRYAKQYHFEAGSMLPKARACIDFVRRTKKPAVIGSIGKADGVFKMRSGTVIVP